MCVNNKSNYTWLVNPREYIHVEWEPMDEDECTRNKLYNKGPLSFLLPFLLTVTLSCKKILKRKTLICVFSFFTPWLILVLNFDTSPHPVV